MSNNTVIVGFGEIGHALSHVLQDYDPKIVDLDKGMYADCKTRYLHICFPWSDSFEDIVKEYQKEFAPRFTIIHSTVPPGTARKLGAVSSPVIGIHPYLETSLKAFVKFLGGKDASSVADYFKRAGMRVYLFDDPETPELMKVLDTTFYGVCIEYTKEVKRLCKYFNVPFEAWTLWTNEYNNGYGMLGYPEYIRPNLVPIDKKIGGHCVLPNTEFVKSRFTELLQELNNKYEKG